MQYIAKIDKEKLGKYRYKIITEDVILTEERIKHIKEHHPGDYEKYGIYIRKIIEEPDYILEDNKNIDTVLYLKNIKSNNKNIQIVVKLNTKQTENNRKNSILTLWKIKNSTYNQLVRNRKVIWKKLDKDE